MLKSTDRNCQRKSIAQAGYDSDELAKWYADYFANIINR
jgi:hypothetical protein